MAFRRPPVSSVRSAPAFALVRVVASADDRRPPAEERAAAEIPMTRGASGAPLTSADEEGRMGVRLRDVLAGALEELRYEPVTRRVRAELDGTVVVDSDRAVLVWEPRRVVPTYAVPVDDVLGEVVQVSASAPIHDETGVGFAIPEVTNVPVLDPRIPFAVRFTDGEPVQIRPAAPERTVDGFRPGDPDLAGYVVLDFAGCDRWLEEDEEIAGHPRDPFHRVDVRASSRHVQVLLDGHVVADSTRPRMVFETLLPVRYYLPPEDVTADLRPSDTRTWCPYKGAASYWSVEAAGRVVPDLVWSYEDPLPDAVELGGHRTFFDERVGLVVDGVARPRPVTPWS